MANTINLPSQLLTRELLEKAEVETALLSTGQTSHIVIRIQNTHFLENYPSWCSICAFYKTFQVLISKTPEYTLFYEKNTHQSFYVKIKNTLL